MGDVKIVSADIGFGEVKALNSDGKSVKFRSEFSIYNPKTVYAGLNGKIKPIDFDGKKYIVGPAVESTGATPIMMSDVDSLISYTPLFLKSLGKKMGIEYGTVIAIGLPLGSMGQKDQMKRQIKKYFSDNQVVICAQGVGIFIDAGIKSCLVVDIGHNTIDIFLAENGKVLTEECDMYLNEGICKIINKLHKFIQCEFKTELPAPKLQQILKDREITYMGNKHDISAAIGELVSDYSTALIQRIEAQYAQRLLTTERIIVAGGGAHYTSFRKTKWEKMVFVPDKPEFANSRGFIKIASKLVPRVPEGGN